MPTPDAFRWFKTNFAGTIAPAVAATPFTLDLIAAIAAQETGHIWGRLRSTLSVEEILEVCVGDTLDFDKGRKAFPRTKADLVARPRGPEMFGIARDALVRMSSRVPGFAGAVARPDKFCHGFGIFQVDLQFFLTEPAFFLERQWRSFDVALRRCVEELTRAKKAAGLGDRAVTDRPRTGARRHRLQHRFIQTGERTAARVLRRTEVLRRADLRLPPRGADRLDPDLPAPIAPPPPGTAIVTPPDAGHVDGPAARGRCEGLTAPAAQRAAHRQGKSDEQCDRATAGRSSRAARVGIGNRQVSRGRDEPERRALSRLRGFGVPGAGVARGSRTFGTAGHRLGSGSDRAVSAPTSSPGSTKRTTPATAKSLDEPNPPGRQGTTPEELRDELDAIVDYLAVDKPSHVRYQPHDGLTFCNIYAHDYCHLAGVYLPRVWWTPCGDCAPGERRDCGAAVRADHRRAARQRPVPLAARLRPALRLAADRHADQAPDRGRTPAPSRSSWRGA